VTGWFSVHAEDASVEGYYAYEFSTQSWMWSAETIQGWRFNFETEDWEMW